MNADEIADELEELADIADGLAAELQRHGVTRRRWHKHGSELHGAASLMREWAEGIREEIAENE